MLRKGLLPFALSALVVPAAGGVQPRHPSLPAPPPSQTARSIAVSPPAAAPLTVETAKESRVEQFAADIRAVLETLAFLLLPPMLLLVIWREWRHPAVIIDPIDVPKNLEELGYTPDVVAQRIAAEILGLRRTARWGGRIEEGYQLSAAQIDFTVPGAGVSYRSVIRYLRQLSGQHERRVKGEIIRDGEAIRIVLRTHDRRQTPDNLRASKDAIEELFQPAALAIAELVDPYLLASYRFAVGLRTRNFDATLEAVRHCLASRPAKHHGRAYIVWGNVLVEQRRFREAEVKYSAAARLPPQSWSLYNSRGILLRLQRRFDQAATTLRTAIEIDGKQAVLWCNLGNVDNDRHFYSRALGHFRRAIRLDPGYARAWSGSGYALWRLGRHAQAEESLARAVDLDREFAWSYLNWARLLQAQHRSEEAIAKTKTAAEETVNVVEARGLWGDILVKMERFDEAEKQYQDAAAADPSRANGLAGLAFSAFHQRHFEKAIAYCQEALALDPYFINAGILWADSLSSLRRYDAAAKKYSEALDMDRYQSAACLGWSRVLLARNLPAEAVAKLRQAVEIDPTNAWAWGAWGEVLRKANQHDKAIKKYRRALAADPWLSDAHRAWGNALYGLHRPVDATRQWRRAVETDPHNANALTGLARGLRRRALEEPAPAAVAAMREEAKALLDRALAASRINPWPRRELGWLLMDQKRFQEAADEFELAIALDQEDGDSWTAKGKAMSKLGRDDDAQAAEERARRLMAE